MDIQLGEFADIVAAGVFVQFSAGIVSPVTGPTTITIGNGATAVSYTFANAIAPNTVAFALNGFSATVGGGALTITGNIGFSKSATLLKVVANPVTATLAVGSVSVAVTNARFGLKVGLEGTTPVFVFELKDGTLNVDLSPVGTLNVTRIFVQATGPNTTITAGDIIQIGPSVQYVFGSDIAPATIAIFIEGNLQLGTGGFRLDGTFEFVATPSFLRLLVIATMNMASLNGQLLVCGDLRISDAGIVGGLALGGNLTLGPLEIVGAFTLEVNSTTGPQDVQRFVFDPSTETFAVDGSNQPITQSVSVAAGTVRLFAFAKIKLTSSFTLEGSVTFENTSTHVALDVDMTMSFFSTTLNVAGAARIVKSGPSPGLVLNLVATLDSSAFGGAFYSFTADLKLQINTRGGTGSDANDLGLTRGSFRIEVTNASLTLLSIITLNGSGFIQFSGGVFSMQVSLSGNFLSVASITATAFFSSEGEFEVSLSGGLFLGVTGFNVSATASATVSLLDSNGTAPGGTGPLVLNIVGNFGVTATIFFIPISLNVGLAYNSGTGDLTISVGTVPVPGIEWVTVDLGFLGSARIPYPTITFKSFSFTIGRLLLGSAPPPPVLGVVTSNVLTLNVGSRASQRNLQESELDEGVIIEGRGAGSVGQTIRVSMFGVTQDFDNVTSIVANTASGNDFVEVDFAVFVPIVANLGDGADIFNSAGSGTVTVNGGVGDDRLKGGTAADNLSGGPGSDELTGRAGVDTINGGNDGDRVIWNAGDGNDIINDTGTGGSDQVSIIGTANADQITISGNGAGFTFAVGAETVGVDGVEVAEVEGRDAGDTFTINNLTSTLSVNLLLGAGAADTVTVNGSAGPEAFDLSTAVASRPVVVGGVPTVNNVNVFRLIELGAATVDIFDASAGDTVTLGAGGGNDVINVRSLRSGLPTTVNGGGGTDTINVGSNALGTTSSPSTNSGGNLNKIAALLTVNGNGGGDTMNVDDGVDGARNTGQLTNTAITGLGMGGSITYGTVETLNIGLGSGGDVFTIQSTHGGTTNLNTNDGADTVHVNNASGALTVVAGAGIDTNNVNATDTSSVVTLNGSGDGDIFNVLAMNGQVTVNGGGGADTVNVGSSAPNTGGNVNAIVGQLIVNGNADTDTFNVDDTGDAIVNDGVLTSNTLNGLGMGAGISYAGLEAVNIGLGSGNDTFRIDSTHTGTTVLDAGLGGDRVDVRTISGVTTVNGEAGGDTINVGSLAPATGGLVDGIGAVLTLNGGSDAGLDQINVDDTGDSVPNTGALTAAQITGLGMAVGITYGTIETLNIGLGSGVDTFTIESTHAGPTNLDSNVGADIINIRTISGVTTVNTGAGGGTGGDRDLVTVDDTADPADNTGILTSTRLTGLGMGDPDQSVVAAALGISYSQFEDLVVSLGTGADTFTINSTHNGATAGTTETTTLNTGADTDLVDINDVSDTLVVNGEAGVDTMNVNGTGTGSVSTLNGDAGDEINALLDVDGGGGVLDVMNVDDSRAAAANDKTGTLTATTLRGLELDVGIDYLGLEELNIWLGFGDNTFDIDSTHAGETTLHTAEGEDTVNINDASGLVTVNAEQQNDVINVRATGLGSELRIKGHEGLDTINLSDRSPELPAPYPAILAPPAADSIGIIDAIGGLVVIDGGTEFDTVNVDDSGNGAAKAGTLTLDTLRGLALPAGVNYTGAEDFNLWLGTGADVLFIDSTHAGTTQVFGGDGNATTNQRDDTIAINTISGVTTIHGQAGNDFIEVNVDAPVLPQDAAFGSLDPITGFFVRTHLNGVGAVLNLHGEGDSDQYTLNFAGEGEALVNVLDNGAENNGVDTLIINGADVVAGIANQPNDTFLLRRDFVVLLNESVQGGGFDQVERANYDQNINARLIINGLGGDDKIVADDNSSITTLDGGDGNDTFQIGQVFGTPRDAAASVAPGDTFDTTPVIIGVINDPVTGAVIFDPTSFDPTVDVLGQATINAINAAIAHQAALGLALDGGAYVSDGVNHATTIFGGDGEDLFNLYHNKGTARLEGEDGNDEFIVRAFVTVDLSVQAETEINAGAGADIIQYAINAPVSLDGGAGVDTVVVQGTPFNDNFVVTSDGIFGAGLNVTFANIESAVLDALEGDDTIYILGSSADFVTTVIGGLGSDTIEVMGDVLRTIISDDLLGRSGVITQGLASLDTDFDNVGVNGVGVNVLSLGGDSLVSIQPTGEPLLVTEDGTLASYFISLVGPNAATLADNPVYLTVSAGVASSKDRGNGGASILVSVNGGAFTNAVVLTFDGTTASTVFEIEVMAVDDLAEEGPRLALISHSINSGDPAFDDLPLIDIFVDVVDNDKAGLDIRHLQELAGGVVPDNRTQVLEGGATFGFDDVYSVALTAAPAVGETVTVTLNTDGQVTALSSLTGNSFLVFDLTNWMTPQLVVVTAVEDGLDGIEISTITHAIAGGAVFGGIPSAEYPELEVTVYDDETPGAIVQESDGSTIVVDGGPNDTYRVRLTSRPDSDVTLTLRTDRQTLLSTSSGFATTDESGSLGFFEYTYTFTASNWYQWVGIEVRANSAFTGTNDKAKAFAPQDQNLDQIRGPLIIEGGVGSGTPNALVEPVLLPGETNVASAQNPASTTESGDIDILNIFHTDNSDGDTGDLFYRTVDAFGRTIANPGLVLTGFEMGDDVSVEEGTTENPLTVHYGGGITLNGFEIVEILLGKGDETLNVADTGDRDEKDPAVTDDPATITAIHGGGGDDTITITGRGNGPLVVYGDTSEDRLRYSNDAPGASVHGTSFANDGDDIIDARSMVEQNDGFVGLVAYGGFGNDTIWGSQDDDHLAGGTSRGLDETTGEVGHDFIDGQAGNDHIYGDSHFNVNLVLFAKDQVQAFNDADPDVAAMFTVLVATSGDDNDLGTDEFRESAGEDELWGGDGSDIIFGDHGVISLAEGTRRLTTTGSVERINTVQPTFGGDDILYGHSNDPLRLDDGAGDRIFGGQGGDYIDAGNGNNVVLGDHGFVDLGVADSDIDRIESTETTFAGGADTIFAGVDDDIVIGGRFGDRITIEDGDNIVIGDAGFLQYQDGGPLLGEVSSVYLDGAGTFIQGGNDTISVGVGANTGDDIVIAGLGDDTVTIGNGDNIVFGDDGSVTFQTGSTQRDRITSLYLDGNGDSPLVGAGAGVGNDTIITGIGDDVILGGLGNDTITVADGSNIVTGDEGFVKYQPGGPLLGEVSSVYLDGAGTFIQGGNDTISVGVGANTGDDIVIAGLGDDTVTIGNGDNIVFGDDGSVTFQTGSTQRDRITSLYLDGNGDSPLVGAGAGVGNDTIITGIGDDVILGGLGNDTITVADGSNIVTGDEGFVKYQPGGPLLGEVSSVYLDGAGTFIQGGNDTISVGVGANTGDDVVIAGLGDDVITIGSGNNIALGDEGRILYQTGSGLRGWIESRYLDDVFGIPGRSPHDAPEAEVGDDMITTGVGDDVVIGGLGDDVIDVSEGDNIVIGDEGEVHYQDQSPNLGEITTRFTDGAGSFVQGGDDKITTGGGRDFILSGSGSDTVNAGDGDDVILGDGRILFHPGTSVPASVVSASQDDNLVLLPPSGSVIFAGGGDDIVLAGSGNDWVEGGTGDDILVGDEGTITFDEGRALVGQAVPDFIQTVFFTPDGQLIPGGTDVLLGQDDDDIVIGGSFDDMLDGGCDRDMVFGNNVTLDRRGTRLGIHTNPRFRALTGKEIYATGLDQLGDLLIDRSTEYGDPNWGATPPFWGDFVITVHDGMTTWDGSGALVQDGFNRTYGNNFIAGGPDDDMIFGQRGEDTIQGDGSVFFDVWEAGRLFAGGSPTAGAAIDAVGLDSDPLALWALLSTSRAQSRPGPTGTPVDTPRSFEALDDGDDYIEGGLDDDLIFGNLGQNDIIGGNSNQFGLTATVQRDPSGENMIFGGAGTRTGHSDAGFNVDGDPLPDGQVFLSEADSHARNASVILGDNGNIFRLVGTNGLNSGANLHFNFDRARHVDPAAALLVNARGVDLLDYTRWQLALDHDAVPPAYLGFERVIGGSDLIRGESGDDRIYGMGGDNAIFGDGQDDAIVGGYGDNWISGGTGNDGIISDDGVVRTSRNVEKAGNNDAALSEPLYGVDKLDEVNLQISTPGNLQQAVINIEGELKHTVQLYFFNHGGNDIVYGGLGDDFIHSGWGNDAVSGAEALPEYYSGELNDLLRAQQGETAKDAAWYDKIAPVNPGNILQFDPAKGEFALYDEFDPWRKIMINAQGEATGGPDAVFEFFLNFDETEGPAVDDPTFGTVNTDGNDRIFGDSGNDWLVEGTGRGHVYGGMGDDLINIDDDLNSTGGTADPLANNVPDTHPSYEDITYGGAGRDILIGNTGGDRMLDWVGEFNSFIVPFAPFGAFAISRALAPQIGDYLNDLARSDGADQWLPDWERFAEEFDADPTIDSPDPARNFEPYGELGMIRQQDPCWGDQTGAPADPQPGNIAGGSRDVLRSANFNDGSMDGFAPDSGTWTVEDGALDVSAESLGGDAVSVFHVDHQLPGYFEISAFVKTDKPTGGWKANAYVIFDYQSPTDFKFAGINVSTKKIQMGRRTAEGWIVDVQSNIQIKANQYYHVLTAINGTTVTVVVDNQDVFSHVFAPRIENGWAYGLNWGYVGLGSDNARGNFENIEVRVLPPDFTLEQTETFDVDAGQLTGLPSGDWQLVGGRYDVAPGVGPGLSLVDLGLGQRIGTSSLLDLSTTLRTEAVGGFVFDVYGPEEFKFVALDAQSDQILIGHHTARRGWVVDAVASANIDAGVDYELSASLKGTTASVSVTTPGEQAPFDLLGHVFNSAVVDGDFGLLGRGGSASFDTFTFKTDDPAFAS